MLNQTTENPNVQKAVTIIRELSADDKIREEARKREEALITEKWVLSAAKKEGRAEGMAEGRAEGMAEGRAEGMAEGRAKGMAEGMAKGRVERDNEIIARMRALGMSDEEIDRIINK